MKHANKYIRRFSVQAFSYLLTNFTDEQYQQFLQYLVRRQAEGFFDAQLSLADLLLQRVKVLRGCLTTASLAHCLAQLEALEGIFGAAGQAGEFEAIAGEYVGLLLSALNCRQGPQENQLLFDFLYVLRALTAFAQKRPDPHTYAAVLVRGFSNFLASYRSDPKKFAAHSGAQAHYLKQIWSAFG